MFILGHGGFSQFVSKHYETYDNISMRRCVISFFSCIRVFLRNSFEGQLGPVRTTTPFVSITKKLYIFIRDFFSFSSKWTITSRRTEYRAFRCNPRRTRNARAHFRVARPTYFYCLRLFSSLCSCNSYRTAPVRLATALWHCTF